MAEFLWGIAQHVNDPSSEIISLIRKNFFSTENVSQKEDVPKAIPVLDKSHINKKINLAYARGPKCVTTVLNANSFVLKTEDDSNEASCSKSNEDIKLQPQHVQVEKPKPQCRHVNIQCNCHRRLTSEKTTSVQQILQLDHSTQLDNSTDRDLFVIDAETVPMRYKICHQHHHVFKALKHWSHNNPGGKNANKCMIVHLKSGFNSILNFFKLEKIENVPEYDAHIKSVFKLYRSTSNDIPDNVVNKKILQNEG